MRPADLTATCAAWCPPWGMCALPADHEGVHGWDYVAGEPRYVTMKIMRPLYEAQGLGSLVDRFKALGAADA